MGQIAASLQQYCAHASREPARIGIQLALIAAAASAGAYSRSTLGPLQEAIRFAYSLTDNQMATLQGPAVAVPVVLMSIPLGILIDRSSRARLMIALLTLNLLGGICTGFASGFVPLLLARALVGLTGLAVNPLALSLIADLCTPERRGRALTLMAIGQFGGMAAAFALGGVLLTRLGAEHAHLQSILICQALPVIPIILVMFGLRNPAKAGARDVSAALTRTPWRDLWASRATIVPLLLGIATMEIVATAVLTWTAPALSRKFVVQPDHVGVIMAFAVIISGVAGPIAGGTLVDACQRTGGSRRALGVLIILVLITSPASLFPLIPSLPTAIVFLIGFVTAVSAACVMGTAIFTVVTPLEIRGLCTSILVATGTVAFGLAPILVSALSSLLGGPSMLAKSLAFIDLSMSLVASAVFACGVNHLRGTEST